MPSPADIAIQADGATRIFQVPVREPGLRASLRSVVRRRRREVRAVEDISFSIERGEVVGFLGPNGAGKTTTLKLLSGLLHPSAGSVRVLGTDPARREHGFLRRIALVMGQRRQLAWDIPAHDSFDMLRVVYGMSLAEHRAQRNELVELLDIGSIIDKPVRQLSLGERMKCELAAALMHRPEVLFLDEPTLGLDVQAQRRVREFVARYAERSEATVLLTSHYMADIEALASRVLVIHHGRLQFDGQLRELAERTSDRKFVTVRFDADVPPERARELAASCGELRDSDGGECVVDVPRAAVRERMSALLALPGVLDFTVEDEPIERVMERVFAASPRAAATAAR
jgi:ABC-2 type transport system ATP-binding protein